MAVRCDILLVVVYINITDTKKLIHINILVPLVMELHRGSVLDMNVYYVPNLVQIDYRTCSTHEFRTTLMQRLWFPTDYRMCAGRECRTTYYVSGSNTLQDLFNTSV